MEAASDERLSPGTERRKEGVGQARVEKRYDLDPPRTISPPGSLSCPLLAAEQTPNMTEKATPLPERVRAKLERKL